MIINIITHDAHKPECTCLPEIRQVLGNLLVHTNLTQNFDAIFACVEWESKASKLSEHQ